MLGYIILQLFTNNGLKKTNRGDSHFEILYFFLRFIWLSRNLDRTGMGVSFKLVLHPNCYRLSQLNFFFTAIIFFQHLSQYTNCEMFHEIFKIKYGMIPYKIKQFFRYFFFNFYFIPFQPQKYSNMKTATAFFFKYLINKC